MQIQNLLGLTEQQAYELAQNKRYPQYQMLRLAEMQEVVVNQKSNSEQTQEGTSSV